MSGQMAVGTEPFVNLVIVSASGFGNREDDDSDIRAMHYMARAKYQARYPQAEIIYRAWDAPWKHLARRLHKVAIPDCPTVFLGHSYGCGWGLKRFEKEWTRCGRRIGLALLIDPVPRPFGLFLPGNVFALTRWGTVKTGAEGVLAVRQVNNRPMGRRVLRRSAATCARQLIERRVYGARENVRRYAPRAHSSEIAHDDAVTHATIDGHPEVQTLVFARLGQFLETANGTAP